MPDALADRLAALDADLARLARASGTPGLAVTAFTPDATLFTGCYGVRDASTGRPVTPDTIFGIASITKSVTALVLSSLSAEGRLSLDDRTEAHLPLRAGGARVVDLLSHAAGLPPTPTMTWLRAAGQWDDPVAGRPTRDEAKRTLVLGAMGRSGDRDWRDVPCDALDADAAALGDGAARRLLTEAADEVATPEGLCAWLTRHARPALPPGSALSYSNDGYCLAGHVAERVGGAPLETLVARIVTEPLGMTRTTFDLDRVLRDDDRVTPHALDANGAAAVSPAWQETGRMLGGGMLRSTLADLRTYVRFLAAPGAHGVPVPPDHVVAMREGRVDIAPHVRYGLGLIRTDAPDGTTVVHHTGSLKGVSSVIGFEPDTGVGVVALANLEGVPVTTVLHRVLNAVAGRAPGYRPDTPGSADVRTAPTGARDALRELAGAYRGGEPYGRLVLRVDATGAGTAWSGADPVRRAKATAVRRGVATVDGQDGPTQVVAIRDADDAVVAVRFGTRILWRVAEA